MSLAFQAGAINAGGFLACHRFVTHTTGFATLFATDLVQGHALQAVGLLSVPLFFLLGSMVSAFFVDRRKLRHQSAQYSVVLMLMSLCCAGVVIAGNLGYFGSFGEDLALIRDYVLLGILCFVSGLQNAMVTSASGSVVRTTHLTGLTTDLGIGFVRLVCQNQPENRHNELRATRMRISIIGSFVLGSLLAASIHIQQQYWGFLLPTAISLVLWFSTRTHQTTTDSSAKGTA